MMERVMGIEPTLAAWEAAVLPLNYTRLNQPGKRLSLCSLRAAWQRGLAAASRRRGVPKPLPSAMNLLAPVRTIGDTWPPGRTGERSVRNLLHHSR